MKFNNILISLQNRGKTEEAEQLKQRVIIHFNGVLSETQIMQSDINDLTGIITLFNDLYKQSNLTLSPLEAHIQELQKNGYIIIYGAGYNGKR